MKKLVFVMAMALVLGVSAAPSAQAKEGAFSAGVDLGLIFPSDNLGTRLGYGVDLRYGIMADWDLAFNALFSSKSGASVNDFHLTGYYLYEGWSLGVKLGLTKTETPSTVTIAGVVIPVTGGASATDFSFGPSVAYMFETGVDGLTFGPQADFIIVTGASVTKFDLLAKLLYTFN